MVTLSLVSCKSVETSVETPRKVKCESATLLGDNSEYSTFPGRVVAATDVNLGFRVAGIIDEICATDGSYVKKGEVIARLDNRDYTLQLAATQAEYDAIKAEVDRVVSLYADQSVSANDYDKAINGLRAITSKLEAHKNALADTELRAPINGYINKSRFDKGEAVAAGTPIVTLISSAAPEITIDIPASNYIKQSNFESATASIELFGDNRFNLKLKSVSPKANLNQLYKMTFTVEDIDGALPSVGMSAMVEIRYATNGESCVVVPFSAIVEKGGTSIVWIIKDGKTKSQEVTLSEIKSSGKALISSGITAGEMIVTAGVNSLKEGQTVSILEEVSSSNVGGIK